MRSLGLALVLTATPVAADPLGAAQKSGPLVVAEPAPPAAVSSELERALELYDRQRFADALVELRKVVEGKTTESAFGRQRALFFIGKALYNLQRPRESLAAFTRVVDAGPTHPYFVKTIVWLGSLHLATRDASGASPAAAQLARYPTDVLAAPKLGGAEAERDYRAHGRDECLFAAGIWWAAHQDAARAAERLDRIASGSPLFEKARAARRR